MKKLFLIPLFALALFLPGCAETGIMTPEDSAKARADTSKVTKLLRTFDTILGLAITEAETFCANEANAAKWPCNTDKVDLANNISDKVGEHLARLDAALDSQVSDLELFVTLSRQGWELYGDILDIANDLRGVSPAARSVAELVQMNGAPPAGAKQVTVE